MTAAAAIAVMGRERTRQSLCEEAGGRGNIGGWRAADGRSRRGDERDARGARGTRDGQFLSAGRTSLRSTRAPPRRRQGGRIVVALTPLQTVLPEPESGNFELGGHGIFAHLWVWQPPASCAAREGPRHRTSRRPRSSDPWRASPGPLSLGRPSSSKKEVEGSADSARLILLRSTWTRSKNKNSPVPLILSLICRYFSYFVFLIASATVRRSHPRTSSSCGFSPKRGFPPPASPPSAPRSSP